MDRIKTDASERTVNEIFVVVSDSSGLFDQIAVGPGQPAAISARPAIVAESRRLLDTVV
jgi:hypothetical protein